MAGSARGSNVMPDAVSVAEVDATAALASSRTAFLDSLLLRPVPLCCGAANVARLTAGALLEWCKPHGKQ